MCRSPMLWANHLGPQQLNRFATPAKSSARSTSPPVSQPFLAMLEVLSRGQKTTPRQAGVEGSFFQGSVSAPRGYR